MIALRVSVSSGVPVYLQIEQQVRHAVASGLLQAGDALPSTRRMAAELRINPNTVARAFQNLERAGILRTVPGGGTFIAEETALTPGLLQAEKLRRLRPMVEQLAVEAAQLRVKPEVLHKLLDTAITDLEGKAKARTARTTGESK